MTFDPKPTGNERPESDESIHGLQEPEGRSPHTVTHSRHYHGRIHAVQGRGK